MAWLTNSTVFHFVNQNRVILKGSSYVHNLLYSNTKSDKNEASFVIKAYSKLFFTF